MGSYCEICRMSELNKKNTVNSQLQPAVLLKGATFLEPILLTKIRSFTICAGYIQERVVFASLQYKILLLQKYKIVSISLNLCSSLKNGFVL